MANPNGPLNGVKVVACSTAQAGTVPYMLMADLGAEVIKIEAPDGDETASVDRTPSVLDSIFALALVWITSLTRWSAQRCNISLFSVR